MRILVILLLFFICSHSFGVCKNQKVYDELKDNYKYAIAGGYGGSLAFLKEGSGHYHKVTIEDQIFSKNHDGNYFFVPKGVDLNFDAIGDYLNFFRVVDQGRSYLYAKSISNNPFIIIINAFFPKDMSYYQWIIYSLSVNHPDLECIPLKEFFGIVLAGDEIPFKGVFESYEISKDGNYIVVFGVDDHGLEVLTIYSEFDSKNIRQEIYSYSESEFLKGIAAYYLNEKSNKYK